MPIFFLLLCYHTKNVGPLAGNDTTVPTAYSRELLTVFQQTCSR